MLGFHHLIFCILASYLSVMHSSFVYLYTTYLILCCNFSSLVYPLHWHLWYITNPSERFGVSKDGNNLYNYLFFKCILVGIKTAWCIHNWGDQLEHFARRKYKYLYPSFLWILGSQSPTETPPKCAALDISNVFLETNFSGAVHMIYFMWFRLLWSISLNGSLRNKHYGIQILTLG